ncbi:MAG TPA: Na+:solute symporter, partial [Candidatus Cryptobacteroides intestinipullorum]|nr:Na+:solute symporter [Candidatus Cryptobacteroides intestinipullorum]
MFNNLDYIIIAAFFVVLLLIPAITAIRSKEKGAKEYFKSSNSMPWWLIGFSMVAATTSTNSANLFTEIIRRDGMSGNWTWWAFLLTGLLTVFVYSRLWMRSGATTDISFYELRYSGKPAAFLRGFRALYLGVIYNLVVMATVLLGAVKIGVVLFGVPAWVILLVTGVISFIYSCLSGIRGTIYTDFFQFVVVMVGAFVVMHFSVNNPAVGGWANLMSNPEVTSRLSFFPDFSDTDALIAIFIIPVAVQWWNVWYSGSEPGGGGYIVQRMLTAKNSRHAVGGTLFFNVLNYALRPWPWYIAAFASILIFPNLDSIAAALPGVDSSLIRDDMAYPALIMTVPNGWVGLVAASLMGALFSTIAAQISMGANYVTNDIWKRFVRKEAGDREMILVARAASLVLIVIGCLMAPFIGSAKSGFDLMVQIGAGTGIIFLLRWFWMRINAWTEIIAMIVSFLCAVFFQLIWPLISAEPLLFW